MSVEIHRGSAFWTSSTFQKAQVSFWIAFVAVPLFTGLLAYHWLPNEGFDKERHESLESHEVSDGDRIGDVVDVWRDRQSGRIFSRVDFATHKRRESKRMAVAWFLYGLIGSFVFAFTRWAKGRNFSRAFGIATLVNLASAAYTWYSISQNPP
jgi:hypothetical protein